MDKSVARLNWESDISIADYIQSASEKIELAVTSSDTERQFLKDVSNRLENAETRFQTIQLCKILLYSDLFFTEEEARALAKLSGVFNTYKKQ